MLSFPAVQKDVKRNLSNETADGSFKSTPALSKMKIKDMALDILLYILWGTNLEQ